MFTFKNVFLSKLFKYFLTLYLFILMLFFPIEKVNAFSHEWVGVPKSEFGEQLWDRKSIKRNEDGSVRVLSKFIPKTKSEITKDIFYTMDINCFEKSFRDVEVFSDEANKRLKKFSDWQDPNGDKLILGIIGQVCRIEE